MDITPIYTIIIILIISVILLVVLFCLCRIKTSVSLVELKREHIKCELLALQKELEAINKIQV